MGNAGSGGNGSSGGIRQRFNMSPSKSSRQLMPSSMDSGPMDGSEQSPAEGEDPCADWVDPAKDCAEGATACKTPSNDGTKIGDPRSPTDDITRTPIYGGGAGGDASSLAPISAKPSLSWSSDAIDWLSGRKKSSSFSERSNPIGRLTGRLKPAVDRGGFAGFDEEDASNEQLDAAGVEAGEQIEGGDRFPSKGSLISNSDQNLSVSGTKRMKSVFRSRSIHTSHDLVASDLGNPSPPDPDRSTSDGPCAAGLRPHSGGGDSATGESETCADVGTPRSSSASKQRGKKGMSFKSPTMISSKYTLISDD